MDFIEYKRFLIEQIETAMTDNHYSGYSRRGSSRWLGFLSLLKETKALTLEQLNKNHPSSTNSTYRDAYYWCFLAEPPDLVLVIDHSDKFVARVAKFRLENYSDLGL